MVLPNTLVLPILTIILKSDSDQDIRGKKLVTFNNEIVNIIFNDLGFGNKFWLLSM